MVTLFQSGISTGSSSPPAVSSGATGASVPSTVTPGQRSGPSPPAAAGSNQAAGGGAPRCCDTGRPIFQDPITGQTVCSCQYELLSYRRLATAGVPLSVYSANYSEAAAAAGMAAYFPGLAADQPPFYTNAVSSSLLLYCLLRLITFMTFEVF